MEDFNNAPPMKPPLPKIGMQMPPRPFPFPILFKIMLAAMTVGLNLAISLALSYNREQSKRKELENNRLQEELKYLKINQVAEPPFLTHMTFRQITESLPKNFIQIHRSYIVNMKHVTAVERTQITLNDGTQLPVSDTRRAVLMEW